MLNKINTMYGQNPPSVISYLLGLSKVQEVNKTQTTCADILHILKDNLVLA